MTGSCALPRAAGLNELILRLVFRSPPRPTSSPEELYSSDKDADLLLLLRAALALRGEPIDVSRSVRLDFLGGGDGETVG